MAGRAVSHRTDMTNQTATADTDPQVHPTTLLPQEYAATRDKIAKINARAIKRGFTGRLEVTGTRRIITNKGRFPDLPAGARVTVVDTTITGEAPCYAGWRFLASLDVLPAGESVTWIVRSAAGTEANVDRSTLIVGYCGHCTTNRPNRRKSYLVENVETGERIQVGSACIKDFLGHEGKPVFLSTEDIEAGRGRGSYTPQSFETTYALALAFAVAEVGGGFKAASSFGVSTRDLMASYLWGNSTVDRKLRAEVDAVLAAHTAAAESIRTAVREHFEDEDSDYAANMVAVLEADVVESRQFGLLASTVGAYARMRGEHANRKDAPEPVEREWLGTVGDKVEVTGVVATAMTVDGFAYNTTQRFLVVDAGATLAKIYTSAAWSYDVRSGDTVTLSAVVKKHEMYGTDKQTVLTRAKRIEAAAS